MSIMQGVKPQKLKLDRVRRAARRLYREKHLTGQHPVPSKRECVYTQGRVYHCAVGAALSVRSLDLIKKLGLNKSSVMSLIKRGVIEVSEKELGAIQEIQRSHDVWAMRAGYSDRCLVRFLNAIGWNGR